MRNYVRLTVLLGVGFAVACGGASDHASESCVPGRVEECPCDDGRDGVQVCAESGDRFEGCQCDEEDESSSSSASNDSGGFGGSSSSEASSSDSSAGGSSAGGSSAGGSSAGGSSVGGSSSGGSAGAEPDPEPGELLGLDFRVVDAEYSKALEQIVAVSASPDELHVLNPMSGAVVSVQLPTQPTAVSVGPDGLEAAVGHDGFVTLVDLVEMAVIDTYSVSTEAVDIVLADNGYAYVFPLTDQWETIRCLELATGEETLSSGSSVRAGTLAKLHPDGTKMYGANNGVSPSDIEHYDITAGTATIAYDSPYHGDYDMCGDLWISDDGERIFTKCANVFRSSDVREDDMTYNGSLGDDMLIRHLWHAADANKVLVIEEVPSFGSQGNEDTALQIYEYDYFNYQTSVPLPSFEVGSEEFPAHGRFVFSTADASAYHVLVQADPTASLLEDWAVVTLTP